MTENCVCKYIESFFTTVLLKTLLFLTLTTIQNYYQQQFHIINKQFYRVFMSFKIQLIYILIFNDRISKRPIELLSWKFDKIYLKTYNFEKSMLLRCATLGWPCTTPKKILLDFQQFRDFLIKFYIPERPHRESLQFLHEIWGLSCRMHWIFFISVLAFPKKLYGI